MDIDKLTNEVVRRLLIKISQGEASARGVAFTEPLAQAPGMALAPGFSGAVLGSAAAGAGAGAGAGAAVGAGAVAGCGPAGAAAFGAPFDAAADCGCPGAAAKKALITEDKAMNIAPGSKVTFPKGTIITPLAKDVLKDRKVCVELV